MKKQKTITLALLLLSLSIASGCASTDSSSTSPEDSSTNPSSVTDDSSLSDITEVYTLTFIGDSGVTGTFLVDDEEVTEASEGDLVVISLTLAENYELLSLISDDVDITDSSDTYSFTMPASDVTITATSDLVSYQVSVDIIGEGVEVTTSVDGEEVSEAQVGSTVQVDLTLEDDFELSSITLSSGTLSTITEGQSYSFVMPATDVTITVSTREKEIALTYEETDGIAEVKFTTADGTEVSSVTRGTVVDIYVRLSDSENYRLDGLKLGDIEATEITDSIVDLGEFDSVYSATVTTSGVVSFDIASKHEITLSGSGYEVMEAPESALFEGETCSFRIKPSFGISITSVSAENADITADSERGSGWYSFVMPDEDVTVDVSTTGCEYSYLYFEGDGYTNIVAYDEYGTSVDTSFDLVNAGTTIYFSFDVQEGYELDSVTYTDDYWDTVTELEAVDGVYSFVVPDYGQEVFITITCSEPVSYNLTTAENQEGDSQYYTVTFTDAQGGGDPIQPSR